MKLDRLSHFAAVVETGSFTGAARRLSVTKAVVSAHVARLEEELGTALLTRTTRQIGVTDAGRMLYERSQTILREADEAVSEIAQSLTEPRGLLRVTAPNDYGEAVLMPLVAQFRELHPACRVELDLGDSLKDIQSGDWDMAVRLGWPVDSSLKSRRIGTFRQYLVARSDRAPLPDHPEQLPDYPFIANSALPDPYGWRFFDAAGLECAVRVATPVAAVNSTPALLCGALHGIGLAVLPDFLVDEPLRDGRLQHVLPDWTLRSGGVHIVYPPVRFRLPKVRKFAEMLIAAETRWQHACNSGNDLSHSPAIQEDVPRTVPPAGRV